MIKDWKLISQRAVPAPGIMPKTNPRAIPYFVGDIDSLNQMPMPFPSFMLDAFATLLLTFELTS
jgi:hypothetical protein